MGPKDANEMENSFNPDQTSFWVHIVCQDLTVRNLCKIAAIILEFEQCGFTME